MCYSKKVIYSITGGTFVRIHRCDMAVFLYRLSDNNLTVSVTFDDTFNYAFQFLTCLMSSLIFPISSLGFIHVQYKLKLQLWNRKILCTNMHSQVPKRCGYYSLIVRNGQKQCIIKQIIPLFKPSLPIFILMVKQNRRPSAKPQIFL